MSQGAIPASLSRNLDLLVCPACGGSLRSASNSLECAQARHTYPCTDGIVQLFWPNEWDATRPDVTETVKAFYEENPFPSYEDVDSAWSLREKAREGIFAPLLDEQIPSGARILEVGCGTGQLSNFLSLTSDRSVFGVDLCMNSLRLGARFAKQQAIDSVAFCQMNLFRPAFRQEVFHLVIANGVLHHTSDPYGGFRTIAGLLKPGGFIMVGLYNTFGRLPTHLRRHLFRFSRGRLQGLDARLRVKGLSDVRKRIWRMDQYHHPHESSHTFGEVLRWFRRTGIEFVNSIPKARPFEPFSSNEPLFKAQPGGGWLDLVLVELGMLLGGGKEGGFFLMIGRRKST